MLAIHPLTLTTIDYTTSSISSSRSSQEPAEAVGLTEATLWEERGAPSTGAAV